MKTIVDARRVYQDSAIRGATPIELVVILYDSAIDNMRRALAAMQENNIETRTAEVQHALLVLQQLQGTLDFERGGSAARQFEQFYNLVRAKLLEGQMRSSPELILRQMRLMSEVRDCWMQAKRLLQPQQASSPLVATGGAPGEEGGPKSEWNA